MPLYIVVDPVDEETACPETREAEEHREGDELEREAARDQRREIAARAEVGTTAVLSESPLGHSAGSMLQRPPSLVLICPPFAV